MVNKHKPGIIDWIIGDRSSQTFKSLWQRIKTWNSFWYVTDGWKGESCLNNNLSVFTRIYREIKESTKTIVEAF